MYTYINFIPYFTSVLAASSLGWFLSLLYYRAVLKDIAIRRVILLILKQSLYIAPIIAVTPNSHIDWLVPLVFATLFFTAPFVTCINLIREHYKTIVNVHWAYTALVFTLIGLLYVVAYDALYHTASSVYIPYVLFTLGTTLTIFAITPAGLIHRAAMFILK